MTFSRSYLGLPIDDRRIPYTLFSHLCRVCDVRTFEGEPHERSRMRIHECRWRGTPARVGMRVGSTRSYQLRYLSISVSYLAVILILRTGFLTARFLLAATDRVSCADRSVDFPGFTCAHRGETHTRTLCGPQPMPLSLSRAPARAGRRILSQRPLGERFYP